MKKPRWQINVSRPVLARNRRDGKNDPPIIVRDYHVDGPMPYTMAQAVRVLGPSTIVHDANSVWIETDGAIELDGAVPGLDQ